MSTTESTRRSIGDKLLILGAHYNAHPELPGFVLMLGNGSGLEFRILPECAPLLSMWAGTLSDVRWTAEEIRQEDPVWSVSVHGSMATMPIRVSASVPLDFADTAEAVIAKLTAEYGDDANQLLAFVRWLPTLANVTVRVTGEGSPNLHLRATGAMDDEMVTDVVGVLSGTNRELVEANCDTTVGAVIPVDLLLSLVSAEAAESCETTALVGAR